MLIQMPGSSVYFFNSSLYGTHMYGGYQLISFLFLHTQSWHVLRSCWLFATHSYTLGFPRAIPL